LGILSRYYNPKESLEKASREVMAHLVHINTIIAFLDLTILDLEYSGLYDIQTTYKALVYRVKFKLEFSILSRCIDFTKNSSITSQSSKCGLFKWKARESDKRDGQGAGYKAYIHSAGTQDPNKGDEIKQTKFVVITIQVSVHRDVGRNEQDSKEELENIDSKSGVTSGANDIGNNIISPSSLQIRFANSGF
jgi:hypothetical protein